MSFLIVKNVKMSILASRNNLKALHYTAQQRGIAQHRGLNRRACFRIGVHTWGFQQKEPRVPGRMSLHVKTTLEANRLPTEATGALLFLELSLVCRSLLCRGAAG